MNYYNTELKSLKKNITQNFLNQDKNIRNYRLNQCNIHENILRSRVIGSIGLARKKRNLLKGAIRKMV